MGVDIHLVQCYNTFRSRCFGSVGRAHRSHRWGHWFESSKHHHFLSNAEDFFGALAQLVARLNGIQKVRGSTPLCSTIKMRHPLGCLIFMSRRHSGREPSDGVNDSPAGCQSRADRAPSRRERELPYAPPHIAILSGIILRHMPSLEMCEEILSLENSFVLLQKTCKQVLHKTD